MRLARAGTVLLIALAALPGCSKDGGEDAEQARARAEEFLHRVGAYDAKGACEMGLSRDGATPLTRNETEMQECVQLFTSLKESDTARQYAVLTRAKVHRVSVEGDKARVAKADTEGADAYVENDKTIALLRVDGTWYVGSDDTGEPVTPSTPAAPAAS